MSIIYTNSNILFISAHCAMNIQNKKKLNYVEWKPFANRLRQNVAGSSHTFRYQQPPVSSQGVPQPQLQVPPVSPIPSHYSRPPHQMHCPTYPPSYYAYGQHPRDMCYSPPYQSGYYTPKVYPTAYRQYMPSTSYYQTVPPSELYEHPGSMHQPPLIPPPVSQQTGPQSIPTSTAPIQPQPQQMQSPNTQLVPSIPNAPHLEPYSPYYTPGYNHGGGYTRSIQPPFIGKQKYGHCIHTFTHSCDLISLSLSLFEGERSESPLFIFA